MLEMRVAGHDGVDMLRRQFKRSPPQSHHLIHNTNEGLAMRHALGYFLRVSSRSSDIKHPAHVVPNFIDEQRLNIRVDALKLRVHLNGFHSQILDFSES